MARKIAAMALIGVIALGGFTLGCEKGAKQQKADEGPMTGDPKTVVGKVGNEAITLAEVDRIVQLWKNNGSAAQMDITSDREFQRKAFDTIVDQKVLLMAAKKDSLAPKPDQVEQVVQGLQGRFNTTEEFQNALRQQGLTEEQLRSDIVSDLAIRSYIDKAAPDTFKVTPEAARQYYDEHSDQFESGEQLHARHILVKFPPSATDADKAAARQKAERLLEKIRAGADFAAVAKDSSDDGSATRGGDLGRFGHGQMVPPFDEAAFKLEPGQVSDIVETQFGYHIIKIEEKFPSQKIPYDPNLESRVIQVLARDQRTQAVKKRVDELRATTKIDKKI